MERSGGCRIVQDQVALSFQITALYNDALIRSEMGMSGQNVSAATKGASERNVENIRNLLDSFQG